uniref:Uncharacterized protein n=1 Tax=Lotharella oceanica TaxID=641309 RepID=A0A7S2X9L7_9EUKA|mmetsp:Transcript_2069/g.3968  ORF Transcript_2069/g.3968 Transcript_2069/m.3968 type:complete len:334 (+) Transcript_2069:104-1105(+)
MTRFLQFIAEDASRARLHAQRALDSYLQLSDGKDHPSVAVGLRALAIVTAVGGNNRGEVEDLLQQSAQMWARMYEGAYRDKLLQRFRKTLKPGIIRDDFKLFDGLLTPADCESIISLANLKIAAQEEASRRARAAAAAEYGEEDDDEHGSSSRTRLSPPDEVVLKFYESLVLTRLALSAALLAGVPLYRISDAQVSRVRAGKSRLMADSRGVFGTADNAMPIEMTLCVYLNDDFKGGELKFPNVDSGINVNPVQGRAVLYRCREPGTTQLLEGAKCSEPECTEGDMWMVRLSIGPANFQNWLNFGGLDPMVEDDADDPTRVRLFDFSTCDMRK